MTENNTTEQTSEHTSGPAIYCFPVDQLPVADCDLYGDGKNLTQCITGDEATIRTLCAGLIEQMEFIKSQAAASGC